MGILEYFTEEMNRTYSLYPKFQTLDGNDEVVEGFVASPTLTSIKSAYYTGAAAEALLSDRYKTKASGVVISTVQAVPAGAKIVLDNGLEFTVIHADDIMMQGEVLAIAVQAVDYGSSV